jgi:hypothetical protein
MQAQYYAGPSAQAQPQQQYSAAEQQALQQQQMQQQQQQQQRKVRVSNPEKQPSVYSQLSPLCRLQHNKSNSTSSVFTVTNITCPKIIELVSSVSTMLHCQMMRDREAAEKGRNHIECFAEERYTNKVTTEIPTVNVIYSFLKNVFEVGQFHPECCVISLVYVNRLIGVTGVPLSPSNWKPITIAALVVAQKVWDDTPLINADFSILYPPLSVRDINYLERKLLALLDFKLTVSPSLYAQYFFELRSICEDAGSAATPNPKLAINRHSEARAHYSEQYQKRKKEYKKITMLPDTLLVHTRRQIIN